ncbi:MAG: O-antigen ligase family protein [Anaerolineae bacterium]|nr:O-antigen ligase family protein [Anaerolineae bacterium]
MAPLLTLLSSHHLSLRRLPVQAGIVLAFVLFPAWLKLPGAPPPFSATYILGLALALPVLWTGAAWLLTGCPGLRGLLHDRWRAAWALALLLLVVWSWFSQGWALVREAQPGVAQNHTLHLALLAAFLLATACAGPPPRVIVGALCLGLAWNVLLGGAQVAEQGSVGLRALGEVVLYPARSGTSVIEAAGVRWLRPYGLLPHPNILAGVYLVGTLAALSLTLHRRPAVRLAGLGLFGAGLWLLLLSFSRGAWLGAAAGGLVLLAFWLRQWRRLLPAGLLALLAGSVFLALYHPFVLARAGAGQPTTEMRSIADRLVYQQIAVAAIQEQPILGVGGGNFPWYASFYLFYRTDYDLRGDNVHNVYLGIQAEQGLVGVSLFSLFGIFGIIRVIQNVRQDCDNGRIAFLGSVVALAVVGLVDHYPWTLLHGQVMWAGLLAVALCPAAAAPVRPVAASSARVG